MLDKHGQGQAPGTQPPPTPSSIRTFENDERSLGPVGDPAGRVLRRLVQQVSGEVVEEVDAGGEVQHVFAAPEGEACALEVGLAQPGGLVRAHPVVLRQLSVLELLRGNPSDEVA